MTKVRPATAIKIKSKQFLSIRKLQLYRSINSFVFHNLLWIFLDKTLLKIGSTSSASWTSTGRPYLIANSTCFKKSVSVKERIFRCFFCSLFLIQFNACCWGSMQSGNLDAFRVSMPFCTDNSSGGRPSEFHLQVTNVALNIKINRIELSYTFLRKSRVASSTNNC